jgi:3-oxoacyl-[acyl-carrier-protein] synthase-3
VSTVIIGTGSDLPAQIVTNDDIEAASEDWDRHRAAVSLDEWVTGRIGIASRSRIAAGEGTSDMATRAARRALADAGLDAADLDLVVLSTFTNDHRLPNTVSLVQAALGTEAKCFQLDAACMGFVDAMITADALLASGRYRTALVVHAEAMSAICDPRRFLAQALFGDGAGAVVLAGDGRPDRGLVAASTHTDGTKADWLVAGGGVRSPITAETLADRSHYFDLDNRRILPFAVEKLVEAVWEVVNAIDGSIDDVDWFVCHQTGANITLEAAERLKVEPERFLMTLEYTGNTSGATIPIALDIYRRAGFLAPGQRIVLPAVGAGMAWGALYLVWDLPVPSTVASEP